MSLFKPRTTEEILNDSINYVHFNTNLTDFNVGSVIRTILEAFAYEDAEQYSQMLQIINSFFLKNTFGEDLDDRAAAYDLVRLAPSPSLGDVVFLDTQLSRSFLTADVLAGDPTITVNDAAELQFGTPFVVRLGEGGGEQEDVSISAVNVATNTLTVNAAAAPPLNAITFDHTAASTAVEEIDNVGHMVCLVTGDPDRVAPAGIILRSKPTNTVFQVEAATQTTFTQINGNFVSNAVPVLTTTTGAGTVVPERRLNQILGSGPYSGAVAMNLSTIAGGRDVEGDTELRDRIKQHIAGLSAGTVSAIASALLKVVDPTTSQAVQRISIREDFEEKTVFAYIDDGSVSFIADVENFPFDTLLVATAPADSTLTLATATDFPAATLASRQYIIVDTAGLSALTPIATQYSDITSNVLNLVAAIGTTVDAERVVSIAEAVSESTEAGRKYYFLQKFPLSEDALLLYKISVAGFPGQAQLLVEDTDYILNKAVGQIEFLTGKVPSAGNMLFAVYENYINLIKTAQNVVDGDLLDMLNFPGIRSAGVKVLVRPAKKQPINIVVNVTVDSTVTSQATAAFLVQQLTISYINNLNIGETVILAEVIDRAMSVEGVIDAVIDSPGGNVASAHDEAPFANNILVT